MNEQEAVEVMKSCQSLYQNLHDKARHNLSDEEIRLLNKFKTLWDSQLTFDEHLIKEAGLNWYKFAFLGGFVYQHKLEEFQA
jgi:hypothetical protein